MTESVACPHCGLVVPADTWYCPKCRYKVSDRPPGTRLTAPPPQKTRAEANFQKAGWIVIGLAGFTAFVGLFSGQACGTTPETERFGYQALGVGALLALVGLGLLWRSWTLTQRRKATAPEKRHQE